MIEQEVGIIVMIIVIAGILFELICGLGLLWGKSKDAIRLLLLHIASNIAFFYFLYVSLRANSLTPVPNVSAQVCFCVLSWAVGIYAVVGLIMTLEDTSASLPK